MDMLILRKLRRLPMGRGRIFPIIAILLIILYVKSYVKPNYEARFNYPTPPPFTPKCNKIHHFPENQFNLKPQVLLLSDSGRACDSIRILLESIRVNFVHLTNLNLESGHSLLYGSRNEPQFYSIIYCSFDSYNNVTSNVSLKSELDLYSLKYGIGQILMSHAEDAGNISIVGVSVEKYPTEGHVSYHIPEAALLRVTKKTETPRMLKFGSTDSTILEYNGLNDHENIAQIYYKENWQTLAIHVCSTPELSPDYFIFGKQGLFYTKLLLIDALYYSSKGIMDFPLERYIQIDIDDIFVGNAGTKLGKSDVDAMIDFTKKWEKIIASFHFVIGFSGKFIYRGNETESAGEKYLLEQKDHFRWFGHMWSHMKSIMFETEESLCSYMQQNRDFANKYKFPLETGYAVAPHHAGVYPVHEPLYHCWREIWGVTVTTTEEFPHLYPARHRRGFIHQGLSVLPRQTCGLFTHTLFYDKFPSGPERLESSIYGGELYQQMIFGEFNVFMTHVQNYGSDRLSLYTFERLFTFLGETTNFKLLQVPALQMAEKYYKRYPAEAQTPLWTNPCADKRHLEITPAGKLDKCNDLPDFIILGPQKTGTTALMSFLKHHPSIESSFDSPTTYEELQFFSGQAYDNGLNWYMDLFPKRNNRTNIKIFEKSATYFTSTIAQTRLKALLPKVQLVAVLLEPGERAYSWYQHQKAHGMQAATTYSFNEVLNAKSSNKEAYELQQRCLNPGNYTRHLQHWMQAFSARQIVIVDGNALKSNPIPLLNRFQKQVGVQNFIDFKKLIQFDNKKGYYCPIVNGKSQCLGISKGRKYPDMDLDSRSFLSKYFAESNADLVNFLSLHSKGIPSWLMGGGTDPIV